MSRPTHVPVLLDRVVALLAPVVDLARENGREAWIIDATLGLGGHTESLLRLLPALNVIGVDRDPHALELAGQRLDPYRDRVRLVHAVYDELPRVLHDLELASVDGVLFDLGVSSMQLDVRDRGFAYAEDAPLDMRMNDSRGITAAEVLNTYAAADLARILRTYGEERFARQIARAICRQRETEPFTTSARLVDLLRETIPAPARRTGGHPAKRTFQALRIEVNDELGVLERAIPRAMSSISVGGRVVVMSYHSLEDRLVKQAFAETTRIRVPEGLPVVPEEYQPRMRLLIRGAEQASETEIAENPRAASVRLRAIERVRHEPGVAA